MNIRENQMALQEHLKIVLKGPKAISSWRCENPTEILDLRGSTLRRAKLMHSNLTKIDLREANLEWADLRWADIMSANLSGAVLIRADFHKADLSNSILSQTDLTLTNFEDANLQNCVFDKAVFSSTRLFNTDFKGAKELSSAIHLDPSKIDQETISNTPNLPIEFLRGCGLSNRQIKSAIKNLVSAEVFSEFLDKATYLLSEGYKDASAVMIGSVLEQELHQLCQLNNIRLHSKGKKGKSFFGGGSKLNELLWKAKIYNQIDYRAIQACIDIRNQAAHGHYKEYSIEQIQNMLRIVLEFLARIKDHHTTKD